MDGTRPQVTVVMAVYKRAQFLREAIDSVLAQTFKDWELILVEDGSHVAEAIANEYGGRVRYVWQEHQGVSRARNLGAAMGSAPWIAFLDDDDLWLPHKLERQLWAVESTPEVALVHTDHLFRHDDGSERPGPRRTPAADVPSGWVSRALFLENFIITSSTLVRRQAFELVGGFDAELRLVEDYDLWIRISRRFPVTFIPERLTIYRVHDANMTRQGDLRDALASVQALHGLLAKDPGLRAAVGRDAVALRFYRTHAYSGYTHYYRGQFATARRHLLTAWRWKPSDLRLLLMAGFCALGPRGRDAARAVRRRLGSTPAPPAEHEGT
jgi:glycosyltransferase involved in cell wall biosynthesis